MSAPEPRLTAVTLGVRDVRASTRFYEALGFERKMRKTGDEISFIAAGGVVLALWGREKLTDDACLAGGPAPQGFGGVTLAWNCTTPAEVDAAFAKAMAAGAKSLRAPETFEENVSLTIRVDTPDAIKARHGRRRHIK